MRGNVSFGGGEKKEVTITAEAAPIVVTPQPGQVFSKVTVNPTSGSAAISARCGIPHAATARPRQSDLLPCSTEPFAERYVPVRPSSIPPVAVDHAPDFVGFLGGKLSAAREGRNESRQ